MKPLTDQQLASQNQFDRQSANYGKSHILSDVSDVVQALEIAQAPAGRALDVATGGGHTAVCLARRGWAVTASDLAPSMLERASELAAASGVSIATALHTAEALPYPDAAFQLVTCRVAAHHFSDVPAFAAEVARVLAPGGSFILIDGSVPDDQPVAEEWLHRVEKLRDPSHGRFLTPSRWAAILGAAGLHLVSSKFVPLKQPDLDWYFDAAATTPDNRAAVLDLVRSAPQEVRSVFQLASENHKITWWWPRLTLVAKKLPPL